MLKDDDQEIQPKRKEPKKRRSELELLKEWSVNAMKERETANRENSHVNLVSILMPSNERLEFKKQCPSEMVDDHY